MNDVNKVLRKSGLAEGEIELAAQARISAKLFQATIGLDLMDRRMRRRNEP